MQTRAGLQASGASRSEKETRCLTTPPNELCARLHNRMPAVLKPEAWRVWLGEQPADAPQLKALLAPYPSEEMISWPVSAQVGSVKNNDPSLAEPINLP